MRHKLFILTTILCLFAVSASAKKAPLSLPMVTCIADVIVTGKIIKVSAGSYTFMVEQTVKGSSFKLITVKMFKEWICDVRRQKPVPGQELLLFLTRAEKDSFNIIDGSTGERFINAQAVSFVYAEKSGLLKEVLPALKNFSQSFLMTFKGPYYRDMSVIQLRSDEEIAAYMKQNEFAAWLFGEMKSYNVIKGAAVICNQVPIGNLYYARR